MNNAFFRLISRILIVCLIGLPVRLHAEPIGTDAVVTAAQAKAARDAVNGFLSRAEVERQLQTLGVAPQAAKKRVNAMTDTEVAKLAGQIERLPAGGDALPALIVFLYLMWRFFWDPELQAKEAPKKGAPRDLPKKEPAKS